MLLCNKIMASDSLYLIHGYFFCFGSASSNQMMAGNPMLGAGYLCIFFFFFYAKQLESKEYFSTDVLRPPVFRVNLNDSACFPLCNR